MIPGAQHVGHDPVEELQTVPRRGPLAGLVRIDDVSFVNDQRNLLRVALSENPAGLRAEDLWVGGRIVLRVR